jgi:hypothetical protein
MSDARGEGDRELTGFTSPCWPLGPPPEDLQARLEAEVAHVDWLLGLVESRGYDLHALAHEREPLTGPEYDRRYNPPPGPVR